MIIHLSILFAFLFVFGAKAATPSTTSDVPARLHWIGKTPVADQPVSFGIPFHKGEMKPTDTFALKTDKGDVIAADFWPAAYWPDGSVKWGGFAAVVPGGTEGVSFEKVKKTSSSNFQSGEGRHLQVRETDSQIQITSGDFAAFIPKSGVAIIDSLVLGGTKVAGHGQLPSRVHEPLHRGKGGIRAAA